MGIVLGPILIAWWIGSWFLAGRMSRSAKRPRVAFLFSYLFLITLPWLDFIGKYAVATFYQHRYEQMQPASPLVVTGFLNARDKDADYPTVAEFLVLPYNFKYVEVEYTARPDLLTSAAAPGFYQFAPAPPRDRCPQTGMRGSRDGILGMAGRCFTFTRTDKPISRYAIVSDEWHQLSFGLRAACLRVVDLNGPTDVAKTCAFNFGPWWLQGFWTISFEVGFPFSSGVLESPETAGRRVRQQD